MGSNYQKTISDNNFNMSERSNTLKRPSKYTEETLFKKKNKNREDDDDNKGLYFIDDSENESD